MASFLPVTAALRVLEVLQAVNRLHRASVGDIFKETGLNRPTIVRMLETLIFAGYVTRHPTLPVYVTTGRTLELSSGYQVHEEMALVAAPILAALHQGLQWPSDVAVFDRDAMVVARTSRGEGRLHFNRRPGYRAPLLGTSLGLAFLAFCAAGTREAAISNLRNSPDAWNAIVRTPGALKTLLDQVRDNGYATMRPEYSAIAYDGTASAVGVPILIDGIATGSLNIMYLRSLIDEAEIVARFIVPLREAAASIGRAMIAIRTGGPHA